MADSNNILEKLDGLVARFEEVSTLITDPAVIADQKRYVKLTKEYKELDDLMKARKEYIQTLANIEEAKDILANESDADMREMAKEELDNSQERLPELEEEIKILLVPADPQDSKMPFLKYVVVRVAMKLLSSPVIFSACMLSSVSLKAGNWKYPVQMREQPAGTKKLFVVSQEITYMEQ